MSKALIWYTFLPRDSEVRQTRSAVCIQQAHAIEENTLVASSFHTAAYRISGGLSTAAFGRRPRVATAAAERAIDRAATYQRKQQTALPDTAPGSAAVPQSRCEVSRDQRAHTEAKLE